MLLLAGLSSCTKERFSPGELVGYYRQIGERAIGPDGAVLWEDHTNNTTHLGLREDGFYYNYYTGSWSVDGTTLRLTHRLDLEQETWTYAMEWLGEDVLLLRRTVPAEQRGAHFPAGEAEEITLYETFRKEK